MYTVVESKNEPGYSFSVQENVDTFKKTSEDVEEESGQDIPLVINGEKASKGDRIKSVSPANTSQMTANASKATKQDVEDAFEAANEAYKSWKTWSVNDRTELILRVSAIIRRRKAETAAIMVYGVGKPWNETVGDAAGGIDFIEYYARLMMGLAQDKPVLDREGEHDKYFCKSIGTGVAIPPWNLPLAVMTGTALAPVVAGNTVLLEPAEDTPYTAYKLMEILEEAGSPKGVTNLVPGDPKEIGDHLVDYRDTHFAIFTGSRATGTRIYERGAIVQEGRSFSGRVIVEMDGKDAIVIDENIDTDMAAEAIVTLAFGFSGQKCSTRSYVIVHKNVYDGVLRKSIKLTGELTLGNTVDNACMGPAVNKKQSDKIKNYIEIGEEGGKLEQGGGTNDSKGYFVKPTIISGLKSKDRIIQKEIFDPVVGFMKVNDFDEVVEVVNDIDYGLIGTMITDNREHWTRAVNEFDVGNLYLNRGYTSAVIGYRPSGGSKVSGTDAKTGSPDYLLHFLEQRAASEMF